MADLRRYRASLLSIPTPPAHVLSLINSYQRRHPNKRKPTIVEQTLSGDPRFVPDHKSLKPGPALGIKNGSLSLVGSTVRFMHTRCPRGNPSSRPVSMKDERSFTAQCCFSERNALRRGEPKRCEANNCALTHLFSPGVDSVRRRSRGQARCNGEMSIIRFASDSGWR